MVKHNLLVICVMLETILYICNIYRERESIQRSIIPVQNTLRKVTALSSGYFSIISFNFSTWLHCQGLVDRH